MRVSANVIADTGRLVARERLTTPTVFSRIGCDSARPSWRRPNRSPWTGQLRRCVSIYAPGTRAFDSNGPRTVTGTSFAAPYVAGAIAAYASEYSVTTQEAWRMVIGHSLPAINVGKQVNTTTRLVRMFSGDTFSHRTASEPAAITARF